MVYWECTSALYFLRTVRVIRSRFSPDHSIWNDPAMASMKPFLPSKTSHGPEIPRMAKNVAWVHPKAVLG